MDAGLAVACALLALWTQRRSLAVYFHPDDLISLEWTRGILPSPDFGLWRLLSGKAYFAAALGAFGTDPFPYHVLNAVVHMANVVLLYALARRWGAGRPAATLAAGLFGSARPAFSVLQQAVGIGELLALALTMGAFLACERRTVANRVAGILLFAAALLCKEAVLLLPLVLLLPRDAPWTLPESWRDRLRTAAPLLLAGLLAALALVIGNVRNRAFGGDAYAMAFGSGLFHNLMTYVSWALDVRDPFFDDPGGISLSRLARGASAAAPDAGARMAHARPHAAARDRARLGGARDRAGPAARPSHVRHLPLRAARWPGSRPRFRARVAGGAARPARGAEATRPGSRPASGRAPAPLAAWAIAAVLLVTYAVASDRLLGARVERRVESIDLPFDRQLRKSEMVRRAAEGLRRTGTPSRIVLYMPPESSNQLDQRTGQVFSDTTLALEQMLMVRVLDHGRALRALVPGLDSVAFVRRWSAAYTDFDLCANSPRATSWTSAADPTPTSGSASS
jgi:hypothetical protein